VKGPDVSAGRGHRRSAPRGLEALGLLALVAGTLAVAAGDAPAQTVRGTLAEEGSGSPIPGAFVVLQDTTGRTHSSTLTGTSGTWLLRAPGPGTFRLRADRIGYASFESEPLMLAAGENATRLLSVVVSPVELSGLAVEGGGDDCQALDPDGLAVYRVWEEARKALAATVWTGQQPYYRFDAVHYQRSLDPDGVPTSAVEYEEVRYFGRHPFRSIPTQDLVLGGFVQRVAGAVEYYGPDADVMLSNDFLRHHCFQLIEAEDDGLIGLEFAPTEDRRITDISGTMWLDPTSSELRWLDFRYENLDLPVDAEGLGGRVEFDRLPSGAWIVQRWAILVPIIEFEPARRTSGGRRLRQRPFFAGIDETGGQVTAVYLTSRLLGAASVDTLPVRPPPDSLIARYPLGQ